MFLKFFPRCYCDTIEAATHVRNEITGIKANILTSYVFIVSQKRRQAHDVSTVLVALAVLYVTLEQFEYNLVANLRRLLHLFVRGSVSLRFRIDFGVFTHCSQIHINLSCIFKI